MRIGLTTSVSFFTLLLVTITSFAVPIWVKDDPDHPLNNRTETSETPVLTAAPEAPGVYDAQVGDTVNFLCDEAVINFGENYGGTDCWGYTAPGGTEYAIMGIHNGVAIVNTETLQQFLFPGPVDFCGGSLWRDMKTYQNYAYIVSECYGNNEGLMVIDLSPLPSAPVFVGSFSHNNIGDPSSHNISIDTVNGYAYIEGCNGGCPEGNSIHIVSLANPASPVYVNSFGLVGNGGIHDIYAHNDTVYVAEGSNHSFSIWDVSNKNAPQLLQRVAVPASGYQHNIWPTDDGYYAVTTEETPFRTVKIWDIQDLGDIQLVGQYLASNNLAHNAQVKGNKIYISHYESGVAVVDITDPSDPVETGVFDTHPMDNPDFDGCWGCYPYTQNGLIYGSNMDDNLYILKEYSAVLNDTLTIATVTGLAGTSVKVDVFATNSTPIRRFIIPVSWQGPYNLQFDSVSTVGTRTEYFEEQDFAAYDVGNKRIAYELISSNDGTSPDLAPGGGPVMSIFFRIPFGASGTLNEVSITSFSGKEPAFEHACLRYLPDTVSGEVNMGGNCCVGIRGNVDGDGVDQVNVADITYLVAFLFTSGPPPPCPDEGNVDAALGISVVDITHLVAYLFQGGQSPAVCP